MLHSTHRSAYVNRVGGIEGKTEPDAWDNVISAENTRRAPHVRMKTLHITSRESDIKQNHICLPGYFASMIPRHTITAYKTTHSRLSSSALPVPLSNVRLTSVRPARAPVRSRKTSFSVTVEAAATATATA